MCIFYATLSMIQPKPIKSTLTGKVWERESVTSSSHSSLAEAVKDGHGAASSVPKSDAAPYCLVDQRFSSTAYRLWRF